MYSTNSYFYSSPCRTILRNSYVRTVLVTFFSPIVLSSPDYNVEFFRQFILVMNALDNRGKAIHVSRFIASPSHGRALALVSRCELELGDLKEARTAGAGGG